MSEPSAHPSGGYKEEDKATKKRKAGADAVVVKGEEGVGSSSSSSSSMPAVKAEDEQVKLEEKPTLRERVLLAYARVRDFQFDDPTPGGGMPETTFVRRFAFDYEYPCCQGKPLLDEYLRFMCLKVVLEQDGRGATPSTLVDAVWHTHLIYTRSYHRLCALLLGPNNGYIHHEPSQGGHAANQRYRQQYDDTLAAYRECFGSTPPLDTWPRPNSRFCPMGKYVCVTVFERQLLRDMQAEEEDDYGDPGCG